MSGQSQKKIRFEFPEKLDFLFEPHRYKVLYGGRDGAKSWSVARALLLKGSQSSIRVGCFREVQKSITASVYQLLCDQIKAMGLEGSYEIQKTQIIGKHNETIFLFSGLSDQTSMSLKSYEGLDIVWVEEAQTVVKRSWEILIPTIRKDGSEIWVTFNPGMETDDTYQRFIINPPPDCISCLINYPDNPWSSKVLDAEREKMRAEDPEAFEHIYMGACRPAVEGAIYYKEVSALKSEGRLCNVPYDPMLKVHIVVDLGYNDFMSIYLVQRLAAEIRIIQYIEDRQRTVASYSQELREIQYQDRGLNWGQIWLPHDGYAKTLAASSNPNGTTVEEQFKNLGWDVLPKGTGVPNVDIETGIRKTREIFPRIYVDKTHAVEAVNRWGRYRRRVDAYGQAHAPVHDDASHGSDGLRYLALVADQFSNGKVKADSGGNSYTGFENHDQGWMLG